MNGRVVYYSPMDLLYGQNLSKIEILEIPEFEEITINDAIEFFQIKRYFDAETRSNTWCDKDYEKYKAKSDMLSILTKRFFNQIDDATIIQHYKETDVVYRSEFWWLFDNCKLYNIISFDTFESLINKEKVSPRDLFLYRNIVRKYGTVLRKYILQNEHCINIVLHVYEQEYTNEYKLILPEELTGEDICNYLECYIDSEHPRTNFLQTIIYMQTNHRFPITDEIRLKAKKRYDIEIAQLAKTGVNISTNIELSFVSNQEQLEITSFNNSEFSVSYSADWLIETLDYPSILNNFIYIFSFVDYPQMRCMHVNKESQSGIIERVHTPKSSKLYPHNYSFGFMQKLSALQMHTYYEFLTSQNVQLEDVIQWFFTEQLQTEYGCAEIRLAMPSATSSYAEKCSSALVAFESVLKQYILYIKNNEIDFELVGMSTTPVVFGNIKSMIDKKYIYGKGEMYERLSFWLFSDQCTFSYVKRIHSDGRNYENFFELLSNETVYISDYYENERKAFKIMADYDLISISDDGRINLRDTVKLIILEDLFYNDVISQWHYPPGARKAFADFMERGIVVAEATLFSQPENAYLNYLLNRSEYSNGLEIRNRYLHGVQQVNQNEELHKQNYFIILKLFVFLAIKINDEFWLNQDKERK